ncbi:hypothetical protein C8035_v004932 [Colletotrichum spinosum]|uniref:Transcription regulator n=1 Tax=Colletotrichum spinosum TaxID=1347390 RepID=A0A4R8QLX7_9PEZI|nr:hypothetical protein C8035_v004932 [Colletotrichum spinosum]
MPLTPSLLSSSPDSYARATQSPFLASAAAGTLPAPIFARWLGNDRLYIHAYIRGVGRLLSILDLPDTVTASTEEKLLQWLVDALVNVRREEHFFITTARGFGFDVELPSSSEGVVRREDKLEGLRRFEELFGGLQKGVGELGWLEGAVLLYATEKCYLDAWSGAREAFDEDGGQAAGGDDVVAREHAKEFIWNWSSADFRQFVDALGAIIDEGFDDIVAKHGEEVEEGLRQRALKVWHEVVSAEEHFWPALE